MTAGKRLFGTTHGTAPWSLEEKAKALELIAKGMIARDIARALGRTRNSVIGWMNRQGVLSNVPQGGRRTKPAPEPKPKPAPEPKPKPAPEPKPKPAPEPKPKPPRKRRIRPLQSAKIPAFHHFTKDSERRYEAYEPLVFDDLPPTMRLIDTVGHTQCRWIPDDPHRDETLVCGRETDGRPYCPLHHEVVYPRKVTKPRRIEAND